MIWLGVGHMLPVSGETATFDHLLETHNGIHQQTVNWSRVKGAFKIVLEKGMK